MPVETTSETTEQQVFTVEEDSPKQSEPDLPDSKLIQLVFYCLFAHDLTLALVRHIDT